jgi:hypothetical protein
VRSSKGRTDFLGHVHLRRDLRALRICQSIDLGCTDCLSVDRSRRARKWQTSYMRTA